MWNLENIKQTNGWNSLIATVKAYTLEKNLNITVARGSLVNQRADTLAEGILDTYLEEYSLCGFSMVSCFNNKPSPPFIAADTAPKTGTARVRFLMDLTEEAQDGVASPFYSKVMGAFATQFFAAMPDIHQLRFPFTLADTVGRHLTLKNEAGNGIIFRE
ncbi:MAG: hypothetical protein GY860_09570 [Desulfobacteraceae bacterium]|nr:hypothetical protein [Desulfobacteraceae bacterium]